jgi:hypothetical protein
MSLVFHPLALIASWMEIGFAGLIASLMGLAYFIYFFAIRGVHMVRIS